MRVLHVTEAMAAGVLTMIAELSRAQVDAGAKVDVLYTVRGDTPHEATVRSRLPVQAEVLGRLDEGSKRRNLQVLSRELVRIAKSGRYDVIHLHSSFAGAVGRLRLRPSMGLTVVYSPHGYAFLREDLRPLSRRGFAWIERLLANRAGTLAFGDSEATLARTRARAKRVETLLPPVPTDWPSSEPARSGNKRPLVVAAGRVSYQKAPWRFAALAQQLGHKADFLWIGAGDAVSTAEWLGDAAVDVSGWVSMDNMVALLDNADIFVLPSLWEGLPLALVHAQARGLPAVVSAIPGNVDVVVDGETGFTAPDDHTLLRATEALIDNSVLRERLGKAALHRVSEVFVDPSIGRASLEAYRRLHQSDNR